MRGPQPELALALASLQSDLLKHPELASHDGILLTGMLQATRQLETREQIREHIEGFQ